MNPVFEVLCLGIDPSGLGVGTRPMLANGDLEFTVAMDRQTVRKAFTRPDRWDLLLCNSPAFYDLGMDRWLAEDGDALHASLVLIRPPQSQLSPAEAASRGASDVVTHGDREHLEMVITRELATAEMRKLLSLGATRNAAGHPTVLVPTIQDYGRGAQVETDGSDDDAATDAKPTAYGSDADLSYLTPGNAKNAPPALDDERVRTLIEAGGLTLEYQPIVPMGQDDSHPPMFEALLRLRDEYGELLPPSRFFPAANRHQWLGRLDLWVFRRALPVLARMQESNRSQTRFFLNLCTDTLAAPSVMEAITATMVAAKLSPGTLVVEVRREVLVHHADALAKFSETLKKQGHGLLLEHFGPQDCGLLTRHARWLDYIKLNPVLLRRLAASEITEEEARKAVLCARNQGVQVIALAVDNANILANLYTLGVDLIQGHFISMPYEELVYPDFFSVEVEPKTPLT